MSATRRLTTTLTQTLQAKADQVTVPTTPRFDPARRPAPGLDADPRLEDAPDRTPRLVGPAGPRRFRLAVATVALVVVLVGTAVATAVRGNGDGADPTTVAEAPDGWLVPGWMPEDMELWDVRWGAPDDPAAETATTYSATDTEELWDNYQLFGDPDADRAIYLDSGPFSQSTDGSGSPHPDYTDEAQPVTVRGQSGWAAPGIDTQEPVDTVLWSEDGAAITAMYKGMTLAEAVAALDSLERRSNQPVDGFAPPPDGSVPLRAEWLSAERNTSRDVELLYSQGTPTNDPATGRLSLIVSTSIERGTPLGYVDEWFWGGSEAAWADDGSARVFDPENGILDAYWPDGREVHIWPVAEGLVVGQPDRATVERITDSLVARSEADLARMEDTFVANVSALPVVASTETAVGRLELHADAGFQRLCLRRPGRPDLDCGQATFLGVHTPEAPTISLMGSWAIDGTWYVAVAVTGFEAGVFGDRGEQPEDDVLTAAVTTDGAWQLHFLEVPADVQSVTTNLDDRRGAFTGIGRPTS